MSDFDTFSEHKARRDHICEHCRGVISKGAKYIRTFAVCDGDAGSYRAHIDCSDLFLCYTADVESSDGHHLDITLDFSEQFFNKAEADQYLDTIEKDFPDAVRRLRLRMFGPKYYRSEEPTP